MLVMYQCTHILFLLRYVVSFAVSQRGKRWVEKMEGNLQVIKGAFAWLLVIWLGSFNRLCKAHRSGWSLRERYNPLVPWGKHFKIGVNAGRTLCEVKQTQWKWDGREGTASSWDCTHKQSLKCLHTHTAKKSKFPHTQTTYCFWKHKKRGKKSIWKCKVAKKSLNVSSASLTLKYPVPWTQVQTAHSYKLRSCSIL